MNRAQRRYHEKIQSKGVVPSLPPLAMRERIAQVTHEAVSRVMGEGSNPCCLYYALIGASLATISCGREYRPIVGSLVLQIAPETDDFPYFVMNARPEHGEFHAWFGCPDRNSRATEIVDLSARHYKRLVDSALIVEGKRPEWQIPEPPAFIWNRPEDFPAFVRLMPDVNATRYVGQMMNKNSLSEMARISGELYRAIK